MIDQKGEVSFGAIVATIGSILIALGVIWLVALNWHSIPSILKILIALIVTIGAYSSGVMLRIKDYRKIGESLLLLGSLLFTWTIFLISQTFHLSTGFQSSANILLISWLVIVVFSYIFDSKSTLVVSLIQFLIWGGLQYISLTMSARADFSPAYMAISYVVLGMLFYGLTQIHKARDHEFTEVYRTWTAIYVLVVSYILSFQIVIPNLWAKTVNLQVGPIIFLLLLFAVSVVCFIVGIFSSYDKQKLSGKEIFSFLALLLVYIAIISLSSLFSGGGYFDYRNLSIGFFLLWIFDNVIFILVILSVIGYGTKYKSNHLINLGILFFVIEVITRYIGFVMDFGGQIGFAIMSILGGIILIFGGWGIEKWRRNLIQKAKSKQDVGYAIS